ncbi:uncharacterized protein LOC108116296 [Drosophila eugracilis]|uniref:uncharacterized protein LOC108116296 n=1 Tax=Drosophila eugracilis TaxID=29029 RepID=UPI001BDB01C6|nr:uncharacterized protein LOC108116296 [Drosophila eugracilis]
MDLGEGIFDRLDDWTKTNQVKSGEMGRILAILLAMVVICYVVVIVSRIVVALALPALVIVVLLLAYRFVSPSEMEEGLKEVPDILTSLTNIVSRYFHNVIAN